MEFDLRIYMNLFVLLPYFPTDYDNHAWKTLFGLLHGYCFGGLDLGRFNCNKLSYWCKCFSCAFIFFHVLQSSLLHTFFWVFEPWINSVIKKNICNLFWEILLTISSKKKIQRHEFIRVFPKIGEKCSQTIPYKIIKVKINK